MLPGSVSGSTMHKNLDPDPHKTYADLYETCRSKTLVFSGCFIEWI